MVNQDLKARRHNSGTGKKLNLIEHKIRRKQAISIYGPRCNRCYARCTWKFCQIYRANSRIN